MTRKHEDAAFDVIVVGARCAGAATAMLLARAGHDVALLDRAQLPRDATSTHAFVRGGMVQLARWGLVDAVVAGGAPPIRSVSFHDHTSEDEAVPRRVKDKAGVDFLLAPRRYALDTVLSDAAVAAGARLMTGTTVTGVLRDRTGRVTGVSTQHTSGARRDITARLVVGADGVYSSMARHFGAPLIEQYEPSGACFYTYVGEVDWTGFEFHLGRQAFGGVFPTHNDQACVWLIRPTRASAPLLAAGSDRRAAWLRALRRTVPDLADRVRAGTIAAPVRGTVGLPNHVRAAVGHGWALVGDAGYHRDPITGHGMTDAFRDAELLATAIGRWFRGELPEHIALTGYAAFRAQAIREVFAITRALGSFPPAAQFVQLQTQLSQALDAEAQALASWPTSTGAARAA